MRSLMFDREKDGTLICSLAGGQSRKRIHSAKDYSGLEMMRVLRDECRNREIPVLEYCPAVELLTDEHGRCAGAILFNFDTERYLVVRARTFILATGGNGRLHIQGFPTTNHYDETADGLVVAYRAGARLLYMDAIQYHPTGAAYPEQMLGWLCTEALRGTGAHLVNAEGKRFINELETRDATSSAILGEVNHRKKGIRTPAGIEGLKSISLFLLSIMTGDDLVGSPKRPFSVIPADPGLVSGTGAGIHGISRTSGPRLSPGRRLARLVMRPS